jgi:hypothetical protein
MNTTSNLARVLSATMAAACSMVLLASVTEQMNPTRLAATPHVVELARVVVTAPPPAAIVAASGQTAHN